MMQLDLLSYTPTPEESTPQPIAKFRLGDRCQVEDWIGTIYHDDGSDYVWVTRNNTARAYHRQDIIVPPIITPNLNALAWHQAKADYYLWVMNWLSIPSGECSPEVKRHEIARLQALREQALAEVKRLGGG